MFAVVGSMIWALSLMAASSSRAQMRRGAAPANGPMVELRSSQTFAEALAALQAATGRIVVSERSVVSRLPKDAQPLPLQAALPYLAVRFDLVCIDRDQHYSFQRRYRNPDYDHPFTRPELAYLVDEFARLTSPFQVNKPGDQRAKDIQNFEASLSAMQKEAMRTPHGLAYTQLQPAQQLIWQRLSANHFGGSLAQRTQQGHILFSHWDEIRVRPHRGPHPGLVIELPIPGRPLPMGFDLGNFGPVAAPLANPPGEARANAYEQVVHVRSSPRLSLAASFEQPIQAFAGYVSLPELKAAVKEYTGNTLRCPLIPADRGCFAFSRNAKASEVLSAVSDVYGWSLEREKAQQYYFSYHRFGPSPKVPELYERLMTTLPPAFHHLWRSSNTASAVLRRGVRMQTVEKALGKDWQAPVKVTALPHPAQEALATLLFDHLLKAEFGPYCGSDHPPTGLVSPEQCNFKLLHPGGHEAMSFGSDSPTGRREWWGYLKN